MPRPTLLRRAAAEGVGTFALVFAGCGAIVTDDQRDGALGVVGVGLVFFLVLLAAIAALGHISGAHFNPGVSLSFFLTRHLPAGDLLAYWCAQVAAATLAALALLVGLARPPRRPRRHRPEHRRRACPPAGGPADRPPHARDHERRDRHPGRRGPGRPRHRGRGRPRRHRLRTPHRRVAQHRPQPRPRRRLRPVARLLDLPRRSPGRRAARRADLRGRARGAPAGARAAGAAGCGAAGPARPEGGD